METPCARICCRGGSRTARLQRGCSESVTARFCAGALVFIVEYRSFPEKAFDNALLEKIRLFDVDPMR